MRTSFSQILSNIQDFGRQAVSVGPVTTMTRPGAEGVRAGAVLGEGAFSNAYSDNEPGYANLAQRRAVNQALYKRDLTEAAALLNKAINGNRYAALMVQDAMRGSFREAMSTSDFPTLFGDIIYRTILSNYRETAYVWPMIAKAATLNDFRQVSRGYVNGGQATLDAVEELGPYTERGVKAGRYLYRLSKFGNRMPFSWETMINDDLNALRDIPARFGIAARRSEEKFVMKLFANNVGFFNATNKNVIKGAVNSVVTTDNPPLSITAIQWALTILASQVDTDGEPIDISAVTLVVPPALKVPAQNILNADYIWATDAGGNSHQQMNIKNWAKDIFGLAVASYLPLVDTSYGNTGWYLFAEPNSNRPALEFGRLRGHESPELFMKSSNSIAIGEGGGGGGGLIAPMEGDFDTDAIHYKVRHIFGGTMMDPLQAVFSNGSGS